MSDLNQTVDRPYAQQPATRAAAARVVRRHAEADLLLDILGLTDVPETSPKTLTDCVRSRNRGAR